MNKKGFTLIELLTVIAILGILVLLAAPKFLGYTEKANIAKIQTGIKSLETVIDLNSMQNPDLTKDWVVLSPDKIEEINDSEKLINKKGLIKVDLEEGSKSIPLERTSNFDSIKWHSGGEFILDKDGESVYYYNKDYNVSKGGDGSVTHPDGSITTPDGNTTHPDGTITTPDGTTTHPDGTIVDPDGTITRPDGTVEDPDGTITRPDGTVEDPDGTITRPDGTVVDPDGTIRNPDGTIIHPDGNIEDPDGTITRPDGTIIDPDGTIRNPDGTITHPDGNIENPDGTITKPDGTIIHPDGSIEKDGTITRPDGTIIHPDGSIEDPDGTITRPDGTIVDPDGTQHKPDGTIIDPDGTQNKPDGTIIKPDGTVTYYLATDKDFVWRNALVAGEGYTVPGKPTKGYYSYKYGSPKKLIMPSKIEGNTITSYYKMFGGNDIEKVVSNNTSVTSIRGAFSTSSVTKSLDLTDFDTSGVTDMSSAFNGASLENVYISSKFNTSNVTNMEAMFYNSKIKTFDFSNFNTSKVTNMSSMFAIAWGSSNFQELDLSSFDTSKVTDMSYMFQYSQAKVGYARTLSDAAKLNASSSKPSTLTFRTK